VGVARRGWAKDNADRLERLIVGYLLALRRLYQKENAKSACATLMKNAPHMTAKPPAKANDRRAKTYGFRILLSGLGESPAHAKSSAGMPVMDRRDSRLSDVFS
jgi:hypothetical protein